MQRRRWIMAYENNQAEFAIYTNAIVVEGEVLGGVYNTADEALAEARNFVAELEGLDRDGNATCNDCGKRFWWKWTELDAEVCDECAEVQG